MPKAKWTKADIPSQKGKLAVVTGATGGLGYETSLALAEAGATVILVGRNDAKGKDALEKLKTAFPNADAKFEKADLGSLASIKEFCDRFNAQHEVLDILVNNAGVMAPPKRETTSDGFELQLGTNYLSHFALTARLLPALRKSTSARVVHVSSGAHILGKVNFSDINYEKASYSSWGTYSQSKLCNLLFMMELQRKSDAGGWNLMSNGAHPGYARTDLIANGPGNDDWKSKFTKNVLGPFLSQSGADGSLPSLFAATSPDAKPAGYYGPDGFMEMKGAPKEACMTKGAKNPEDATKLWDLSVEMTGVTWPQ